MPASTMKLSGRYPSSLALRACLVGRGRVAAPVSSDSSTRRCSFRNSASRNRVSGRAGAAQRLARVEVARRRARTHVAELGAGEIGELVDAAALLGQDDALIVGVLLPLDRDRERAQTGIEAGGAHVLERGQPGDVDVAAHHAAGELGVVAHHQELDLGAEPRLQVADDRRVLGRQPVGRDASW